MQVTEPRASVSPSPFPTSTLGELLPQPLAHPDGPSEGWGHTFWGHCGGGLAPVQMGTSQPACFDLRFPISTRRMQADGRGMGGWREGQSPQPGHLFSRQLAYGEPLNQMPPSDG